MSERPKPLYVKVRTPSGRVKLFRRSEIDPELLRKVDSREDRTLVLNKDPEAISFIANIINPIDNLPNAYSPLFPTTENSPSVKHQKSPKTVKIYDERPTPRNNQKSLENAKTDFGTQTNTIWQRDVQTNVNFPDLNSAACFLGRTIQQIGLDDLHKAESSSVSVVNRGEQVVANVAKGLLVIKQHLGKAADRTIFNNIAKLTGRLCGIATTTVIDVVDRSFYPQTKKVKVTEMTKEQSEKRIISMLNSEQRDRLTDFVYSYWEQDEHPPIDSAVNFCRENLGIQYERTTVYRLLHALKLSTKDRPNAEVGTVDHEERRKEYLLAIEKARNDNDFIVYFSEAKTRIYDEYAKCFAMITDSGLVEGSADVKKCGGDENPEVEWQMMDEYLSNRLPKLVCMARAEEKEPVLVIGYEHAPRYFKVPSSISIKYEMVNFLEENGQKADLTSTRAALYEQCKELIDKLGGRVRLNRNVLEETAETYGIRVLRVPVCDYILNPMELVWGEMKRALKDDREKNLEEICEKSMKWLTELPETIAKECVEQVMKIEMEMKKSFGMEVEEEKEPEQGTSGLKEVKKEEPMDFEMEEQRESFVMETGMMNGNIQMVKDEVIDEEEDGNSTTVLRFKAPFRKS